MSRENFENEKRSSLGHLLIKVGRLYHEQSVERVKGELGLGRLTPAHLDLFAHIDFEGTTVNEIARRRGVSKQAVSRLVLEMIEMGILLSRQNPRDQRSHLVTFETKGPRSIFAGFALLKKLDADLREVLGDQAYEETTRSMLKIQDWIQTQRSPESDK